MLFSESLVCPVTTGVATLGVRMAALCRMASRGSNLLFSKSCVGDGILLYFGVGFVS
jgi:hypothetical protein